MFVKFVSVVAVYVAIVEWQTHVEETVGQLELHLSWVGAGGMLFKLARARSVS